MNFFLNEWWWNFVWSLNIVSRQVEKLLKSAFFHCLLNRFEWREKRWLLKSESFILTSATFGFCVIILKKYYKRYKEKKKCNEMRTNSSCFRKTLEKTEKNALIHPLHGSPLIKDGKSFFILDFLSLSLPHTAFRHPFLDPRKKANFSLTHC